MSSYWCLKKNRVYRLEIMFDPSCELAPLYPSHWFTLPPSALPGVSKYMGMYLYSVYQRGGGPQTVYLVNF